MRQAVIVMLLVVIWLAGCDYSIPDLPQSPIEIPPLAPIELNAEAVSPTEIWLTWQDRSSNEIGFEIQESYSNSNNFRTVDSTEYGDAAITLTNRISLTNYYYRIRAYNEFGSSEFTEIIRVMTPDYPPEKPEGLRAEIESATDILLSWEDVSSNETGFEILSSENDSLNFQQITITAASDTAAMIRGLTPLTTYFYKVRAINDYGQSNFTTVIWATPGSFPPAAPTDLQANAISPIRIDISWRDQSNNEEQFELYESVGDDQNYSLRATIGRNETTINLVDCDLNTTYNYRVRAVNQYGNSLFSGDVSETTPDGIPEVPWDLQLEAISASQIKITWQHDLSIDDEGFKIERKTGSLGEYNEINQTVINTRNYQDTGLLPSTTYFYRIKAFSQYGSSDYTGEESATTPDGLPLAPSDLLVEAISAHHVDLHWMDNSGDEDGFKVERKIDEDGEYTQVGQALANVGEYHDFLVERSTTYYYRVRAFNNYGNSLYSDEDYAATPFQPEAGEEQEFDLGETGETIVMIWITEGNFMMGSQGGDQDADTTEIPRHQVTFAQGFWMGKYEVTQKQWEAVTGDNPAIGYGEGDDYPVYLVSWDDVQTFESELNNEFRLPTEAEWEYACRAGQTTRYYWGEDQDYDNIGDYAVYNGNDMNGTSQKGSKQPNAWNLYDMSGNVFELCEDWYHASYDNAPNDGSAWLTPSAERRIMRGGAWDNPARACRSANRDRYLPANRNNSVGFRLVMDAGQE